MSEATSGEFSVIGKSVPKIDAHDKVTGRAKYAGDLKVPGMLIGKILRSPHAHARILNIDTSKAEQLPGVGAVITAKDVPSTFYGISPARYDGTILAIDKVLQVGDKVAAVAAVNEETGQVMVTNVWDVHDCGTVINPSLLHAQVEGALFMGMGEAMYEQVMFDDNGKPLNANLGEYRVPTALDVPQVVSELVDSNEPAGPWGVVKEVGEGATLPTMGCYANAIYDAIGVRIYDLPLTPEKVWRAIQERKK